MHDSPNDTLDQWAELLSSLHGHAPTMLKMTSQSTDLAGPPVGSAAGDGAGQQRATPTPQPSTEDREASNEEPRYSIVRSRSQKWHGAIDPTLLHASERLAVRSDPT